MRSRSMRRHRHTGRRSRGISERLATFVQPLVEALSNVRTVVSVVAGLALALLAFGGAAAQNSIAVGMFRPLGPSFYAWRVDQAARDRAFAQSPATIPGPRYVAVGQQMLRDQPLTPAAIRTVAWGYAAQGQAAKATATMKAAERVSRRDLQAQNWLLRDFATRGDVTGSLRHFDVLLRIAPALRPELLPRVASVLDMPDARRTLRPLLNPETPWFEGFMAAAANTPKSIAPVADMLLEQPKLPDGASYRASYARIVQRLVDERQIDLLARIYRRLPGADPATIGAVSLAPKQFDAGYPPLTWALSADADWGGSTASDSSVFAKTALTGYAEPGTRGVVASKVVMLPSGDQRFGWRIIDRTGDIGADGYWQLSCIDRGSTASVMRSGNLFAAKRLAGAARFPSPCRTAKVELVVAGGTGGTSSNLTVANLMLGPVGGTPSPTRP